MKIYCEATITENVNIGPEMFSMALHCPEVAALALPGQFVNVYPRQGELILPRPISISNIDKITGEIKIIYQVVGKGTKEFSQAEVGTGINIAGPLGNGFKLDEIVPGANIALVAGGIGAPPLLALMEKLCEMGQGNKAKVFLGFRTKGLIILEEHFKGLGAEVFIATDDGSAGFFGNVCDCFKASGYEPDLAFSCGPKVMLKALDGYFIEKNINSQLSFEERMACGLGSCVGCVIKIKKGAGFEYKKVCVDGPVFTGGEVIFDE